LTPRAVRLAMPRISYRERAQSSVLREVWPGPVEAGPLASEAEAHPYRPALGPQSFAGFCFCFFPACPPSTSTNAVPRRMVRQWAMVANSKPCWTAGGLRVEGRTEGGQIFGGVDKAPPGWGTRSACGRPAISGGPPSPPQTGLASARFRWATGFIPPTRACKKSWRSIKQNRRGEACPGKSRKRKPPEMAEGGRKKWEAFIQLSVADSYPCHFFQGRSRKPGME